MNQRVADILNYLDQSEQPTQTEQTTPSPVSDDENPRGLRPAVEEVEVTPAKPLSTPPSSASTSIDLNMFNDDKVYNKLARQLKKNKFPMIFEGQVLNSEAEAQMFKQQVLASRRDYKRSIKQKKIQESQMNFEAMPTLNEDDYEDLYEDDGYVYKKSKYPYAIHKDGKKKLIPKTSAKDAKKIYKSIESTSGKEGIKHLVKAGTSEEFKTRSDEVMNKVNDEELRNSYYNHTHNDFADDKTWNQESFLKLIYNMMKENEELKSNAKKQQQQTQQTQQPKPSNPFRINPALMKK